MWRGASVAKSPIAIAQFVRGFARSCGACGVLGGGDGGAGNGELAGLAWAAICESGAVRPLNSNKSQPGARRCVVGIHRVCESRMKKENLPLPLWVNPLGEFNNNRSGRGTTPGLPGRGAGARAVRACARARGVVAQPGPG